MINLQIIKVELIRILIEGIIRGFLVYFILIMLPSIILFKPLYIDRLFIEVLILSLAATAFDKYIISPIILSLTYVYTFINTVIRLNGGIVYYEFFILNFKVSFSLDVSLFLILQFGFSVVPLCLIAFHSYYVSIYKIYNRRPPTAMVVPTIREILQDIFS